MFTQPYFGISSMLSGIICPKATTMITSGLYPLRISTNSCSRTLTGWYTFIPFSTAIVFTGEGVNSPFLPFGLSGWVTTAIISCFEAIRASKDAAAKSGVPIKIIFISSPHLQGCRQLFQPLSLPPHLLHYIYFL